MVSLFYRDTVIPDTFSAHCRGGAVSAILKKVEKKMAKIVIFRFFRDTIYIEGVAKRERLTQLEGNYKPLDRERG